MKILFLYSDAVEGSRLSALVKRRNFCTHEMSFSGKEFQDKFRSFVPDLVVLDLEKSEDLAKKINDAIKVKFPKIKRFILVPEKSGKRIIEWQKSEWKADAYLNSPFDLEFFTMIIEDIKKVKTNFFQQAPEQQKASGTAEDENAEEIGGKEEQDAGPDMETKS